MKKTKRRALYIVAALLAALFVLSCLVGFAACGGGDDDEPTDVPDTHTHSYTSSVTKEATCTEKGVRTYTCSCGDSYTEEIAALGHNYQLDTTADGYVETTTCGGGTNVYVCSRCQVTYTETVNGDDNHTWGTGTVTKNATATAKGEITSTCSVCGSTKTDEFTSEYLENFVTGPYESGTSVDAYYYYTNPDTDDNSAAYFKDSSVDVEFDGSKFIVTGSSHTMDEAQLKAYWGQNNYSTYAGDEYVVVTIVAGTGEKIDITTSKENKYTLDGSAVDSNTGELDVDKTFFSSIVDVDTHNEEGLLFTINEYAENDTEKNNPTASYPVVLGDITESGYTPIFTEEALIEALSEGGEIALDSDIAIGATTSDDEEDDDNDETEAEASTLTISKDTELDLNGHTLSCGDDWTPVPEDIELGIRNDVMISVGENATLTIEDTSSDGSGKIEYDFVDETGITSTTAAWPNSLNNGAAIEMDGGELIIESGTVESSAVGIRAKSGDVEINGGTVLSTGYYVIWEDTGTASVTINGGVVAGATHGIFVDGDSNFGHYSNNVQNSMVSAGTSIFEDGAKTTLTVNGGTVYSGGKSAGAIRTENGSSRESAVITITGGDIICGGALTVDGEEIFKAEDLNTRTEKIGAIFLANGTLTISGGYIEGPTALEIQGGLVKIEGGTFVATGANQSINTESSSSDQYTYGYALAIVPTGWFYKYYYEAQKTEASTYTTAVDVSVTGGTFVGDVYVAAHNAWGYKDDNSTDPVHLDGTGTPDADGTGLTSNELTYVWTLNTADSENNMYYKVTGLDDLAGMACKTVYDETSADAVVGYVYTSRVSATASDSDELKIDDSGKAYTAADVTVTYDPDSKTYTISGTSVAFTNDTLNDFWGNNTEKVSEHSSCEYITFTIAVGDGETVKITTYNGDEVQKVRAMYGAGVDKTTNALKDENSTEITEASSDTWVIDLNEHFSETEECDWKMVIEVIGENGTVTETYYVVIGTITQAAVADPE